ncbi:MAG: tRNA adenosine(34) deaminase TadA [Porticoccaceae bacterium]
MQQQSDDETWMQQALEMAQRAGDANEVPVGAVLVANGEIIGRGFNHPIAACDPSCHAEIHCLRDAALNVGNYRLPGTTLYVTIEPCTMCVGALVHARVGRLVFGAREPRAGAVVSQLQLLDNRHYNHKIEWTEGVLAAACSNTMTAFFRKKRGL